MARGGMRAGEGLKLTPNDILDRKLSLNDTNMHKNYKAESCQSDSPS